MKEDAKAVEEAQQQRETSSAAEEHLLALFHYVQTCQRENPGEWMQGLADRLTVINRKLGQEQYWMFDGEKLVLLDKDGRKVVRKFEVRKAAKERLKKAEMGVD